MRRRVVGVASRNAEDEEEREEGEAALGQTVRDYFRRRLRQPLAPSSGPASGQRCLLLLIRLASPPPSIFSRSPPPDFTTKSTRQTMHRSPSAAPRHQIWERSLSSSRGYPRLPAEPALPRRPAPADLTQPKDDRLPLSLTSAYHFGGYLLQTPPNYAHCRACRRASLANLLRGAPCCRAEARAARISCTRTLLHVAQCRRNDGVFRRNAESKCVCIRLAGEPRAGPAAIDQGTCSVDAHTQSIALNA